MSILVSLLKDIFSRRRIYTASEVIPPPGLSPMVKPSEPLPHGGPTGQVSQPAQGQLVAGIAHFRKVLEREPDRVDALVILGTLYETVDQNDDAIDCYKRALSIDPSHYGAMMALLHHRQNRCEWVNMEATVQELRKAVRTGSVVDPSSASSVSPFSFISLPGATAAEHQRCAEQHAMLEFHAPELDAMRNRLAFSFKDRSNDKIKIGYLSSDFFAHATAKLMARTFELHDRAHFHVTAYSYGPDDGSPMRRRLEQAFDQFIDIQQTNYEEAAKRIFSDQIDILVDLKGYTQHSRSGILALRPAPIQVNYLGYPGTLGTGLVDYIIADNFVIPPEQRAHFSERVICLPDCYQPNDDSRPRPPAPSRKECGLPEQGFVFCCFNQTFKVTPEVFAVWCRLLQAVPGSYLWLWANNPHAEANLKAEAARHGISPERLIMAPSIWDAEKHLARLQCADLFLDTLPYNAHTTCSDALWMGLPVVTCAGETFPSRVAGSLLTTLGTPELITSSLEDYYLLALELATNREKLAAIQKKIIALRATCPLFDSARFTANLEQAYRQMIADHTQKIAQLTWPHQHLYAAPPRP